MKTVNRIKHKIAGDVRTTQVVATTIFSWKLIPTNWQLPCGCIGPDIWTSDETSQAECTDCGRGWKHMRTVCEMLDGKPQGKPVLVLTEKLLANV